MIDDKILKYFKGKGVLVTGGTGLIGRPVVEMLQRAGAHVTAVSLDRLEVPDGVTHVFGDITDRSLCLKLTKDQDAVCHLAGIKGSAKVTEKRLASHFIPTLLMNINILDACRANNVGKVVYTSSIGAYAATEVFREEDYRLDSIPMDFAGWAKRMAELQIHAYKVEYNLTNFAIVRPSNVYGPGDNFDPENAMVIPSLMCRIYRKEDPLVVWGDGSAVRDFAFSRDVAEGVILALYHGTGGGFVNLGSGRETSVRELVETLQSFLDFRYEFDAGKPSGFPKRVMDITQARRRIGYDPTTPLAEGLKLTWEWFLGHRDEYKQKKNYFREKR